MSEIKLAVFVVTSYHACHWAVTMKTLQGGISVKQEYVNIIQQLSGVLLSYHLTHPAYFSQLELVININVWVVILVVKMAIITQVVRVIINIYIYIYIYIKCDEHKW